MRRIEIVHESLLSAWPRLVRWQAQDHEGALLRDQLRQAAQVWDERGRPDDLLWAGSAYKDLDAWRERYRGGLTALEEAYTEAMTSYAGRRKRRRRLAIAAGFSLLGVGLTILAVFWLRAERSGEEARAEAARAEASALLALGRPHLKTSPTIALAYAMAALERDAGSAARRFALEALAAGPIARIPRPNPEVLGSTDSSPWSVDISPDGRWLAAALQSGEVWIWPREGGPGALFARRDGDRVTRLGFSADSLFLVTRAQPSHEIEVWAVPVGQRVRNLPSPVPTDFRLTSDAQMLLTFEATGETTRVVRRSLLGDAAETVVELPSSMTAWGQWTPPWPLEVDFINGKVAWAPPPSTANFPVLVADLNDVNGTTRVLTTHSAAVTGIAFHPDGQVLFTAGEHGVFRQFDMTGHGALNRTFQVGRGAPHRPAFDRGGTRLAIATHSEVSLLDLRGPWDAVPGSLHLVEGGQFNDARFGPEDRWLLGAGSAGVALWPARRPHSIRFRGHTASISSLRFLPDGSALVSASFDGTLRLWPLTSGQPGRVLLDTGIRLSMVEPDAAGENVLVGSFDGRFWIVPVKGGEPRLAGEFDGVVQRAALGTRRIAVSGRTRSQQDLLILNLETGESIYHELGWHITGLELTPNDELLLGRLQHGILKYQSDGTFTPLIEGDDIGWGWDLTPDGRYLLVGYLERPAIVHDLAEGTSVELTDFGLSGGGYLSADGQVALAGFNSRDAAIGRPGGVPHLLAIDEPIPVAVPSPDGTQVALVLAGDKTTIHLWPVPDLSQPPLHTLPRDDLLTKLQTHTNLRVVPDADSDTGWSLDFAPFQGWEKVPLW